MLPLVTTKVFIFPMKSDWIDSVLDKIHQLITSDPSVNRSFKLKMGNQCFGLKFTHTFKDYFYHTIKNYEIF